MKIIIKALLSVAIAVSVFSCSAEEDTPNSIDLSDENATGISVDVDFKTSTGNGTYGPAHTQAVWISDADGNVVRTLGRWADRYVKTLSWYTLSDVDSDVKTGASKTSHGEISISGWNVTDKDGNGLVDGTYNLNIEYNEENSVSQHKMSTSVFAVVGDSVALTIGDETSYIKDIEMSYSVE